MPWVGTKKADMALVGCGLWRGGTIKRLRYGDGVIADMVMLPI